MEYEREMSTPAMLLQIMALHYLFNTETGIILSSTLYDVRNRCMLILYIMHTVQCLAFSLDAQMYRKKCHIEFYSTLCSKKTSPLMFDNNFGKCKPIFKIFSSGDS